MPFTPYTHHGEGTADYMCPYCVTPWKCNGPHISEDDLPQYNADMQVWYERGLLEAIAAVEAYADERLVVTKHPNMSEDITAALRAAATRLRALLDGQRNESRNDARSGGDA